MRIFRTTFNPLVPLSRFSMMTLFWGIPLVFFYKIITDSDLRKPEFLTVMLLICLLFIVVGYLFAKPLWSETKNYRITDNSIEVYNFLTFNKMLIKKENIKGFSTSALQYKIGRAKQIIIYLEDGSKWELMKFSYFNFSKINKVLIEKQYRYLGHEFYQWKWPNSRIYKYDKAVND